MKQKLPSLVNIAILTVIMIICWVFFEVYRVFTKEPPIVIPPEVLAPLENFNPASLEKLKSRFYTEEYSSLKISSPTPRSQPTSRPTTKPSPSGISSSPSPHATSSEIPE